MMTIQKTLTGSLMAACVLGLLALALLPALVQASPEDLPPRPATPTSTVPASAPAPAKTTPDGASILLEITFGDDWPDQGLAWQDLWTVVEWKDADGSWHVVEGWQGGVDKVSGHTGWAVWWLDDHLLGQGPFRWVVYERQAGPVMEISDPFHLPADKGGIVIVETSL